MKKSIFIIFTTLSCLYSCNTPPSCNDFKTGTFLIAKDTLFSNNIILHKTILNQQQITASGDTLHANVEWLNDCSYKLTFDKNKMSLSPFQLNINDRGGILVEFGIPKGNIMPYTSVIKGETKTETFKGFLKKIQ